ncbi:MAG: anthranilate synthase component I family protein [Mucilaginibacter polytrichastri]|nr:anthranilate synthase component I family protein [Mucilaginibacter polytrichastri]
MAYQFKTSYKKLLADTVTPVSVYLRLRDIYPNSLLLESSDYHSRENSRSYICCDPVAGIVLDRDGRLTESGIDGSKKTSEKGTFSLPERVARFASSFQPDPADTGKITGNGLFGYFTHETVQYFETLEFGAAENSERAIPFMQYHIYRYVIAIDHFRNELHIFHNGAEGEANTDDELQKMAYLISNRNVPEYPFSVSGEEQANMRDADFIAIVKKMQEHIHRGDVFQIVPSRAFSQAFTGDEFNVYRALRSINPSPYLFYFDYGNFKLFGSSPEAQLTISRGEATIYPIAGTFRRTGSDSDDAELALRLKNDPKESAEHVMLVDLARNDLSRHCHDVEVQAFKEVQFYSHLIHLVSKVSGKLREGVNPFSVVADTFPAGTLSGAPKYRAMQIIDENEPHLRSFYSGAIGYMGFSGDFNHAIMIRSFLSIANTLHYQAGAGIVAASDPETELNEVNNKIAALRKALSVAGNIQKQAAAAHA